MNLSHGLSILLNNRIECPRELKNKQITPPSNILKTKSQKDMCDKCETMSSREKIRTYNSITPCNTQTAEN